VGNNLKNAVTNNQLDSQFNNQAACQSLK
jgi:hypothetical protein